MNEQIQVKGNLNIKVIAEDGKIKQEKEINNLVVSAGKNYITNRMTSNSTAILSHMAIGNSNTAATVSDTTLSSETARVALGSGTPTVTDNLIQFIGTYPAGTGTGTVNEAGIINANTSGDLLCRTTFDDINKAAADSIVITWNVAII